MQPYSAYFCDPAGAITYVEPIYASTDDEAIAIARSRLSGAKRSAVEVWQLTTCIAKVKNDMPPAA